MKLTNTVQDVTLSSLAKVLYHNKTFQKKVVIRHSSVLYRLQFEIFRFI